MDLATLIIDRAKEIENEERSMNFLAIRLSFTVPDINVGTLTDYEDGFELHPLKRAKISIRYQKMNWELGKKNFMVKQVMMSILSQICRTMLKKYKLGDLEDRRVNIQIKHGKETIFDDNFLFMEPVDTIELGFRYINDIDSQHNELCEFNCTIMDYIDMCLASSTLWKFGKKETKSKTKVKQPSKIQDTMEEEKA